MRSRVYNTSTTTGGQPAVYSESRARYAETLDSVVNDREEVVITRAGHEPVVIVSLDDYLWWQAQDRKVLRRINTLIRR